MACKSASEISVIPNCDGLSWWKHRCFPVWHPHQWWSLTPPENDHQWCCKRDGSPKKYDVHHPRLLAHYASGPLKFGSRISCCHLESKMATIQVNATYVISNLNVSHNNVICGFDMIWLNIGHQLAILIQANNDIPMDTIMINGDNGTIMGKMGTMVQ